MSEECIFCKIIRGEIPSHKIYEDEHSFAFLDINPLADGHTMVIPKKHADQLEDLPVEDTGKLFQGVHRVSKALKNSMGAPATTIGINNGEAAGQVVPHLHIHVVPRFSGDGGGHIHSIIQAKITREFDEVARSLQATIAKQD
jgi:histidine triad (HIT) family protein